MNTDKCLSLFRYLEPNYELSYPAELLIKAEIEARCKIVILQRLQKNEGKRMIQKNSPAFILLPS